MLVHNFKAQDNIDDTLSSHAHTHTRTPNSSRELLHKDRVSLTFRYTHTQPLGMRWLRFYRLTTHVPEM